MKKLTAIYPLLLLLMGAASCAASGPKYDAIAASLPPLSAEKGRVFFYRSKTIVGGAVTSVIRLNDEEVGKSTRGSFFFVDRPPGDYEVACSTEAERRLSFTLEAGQERFVRTYVGMGVLVGRIHPELVSSSEGLSAIRSLAYTGAALAAAGSEPEGPPPEPSSPTP